MLLIFDEHVTSAELGLHTSDEREAEHASAAIIRGLESDRQAADQRLQRLIEQHESSQEEIKASNEELQSANEELRSTLEELETSKEELQSMNEELQTVNQENRHKVEELDQLSSDLQNLLVATDIATLFLDRELRILRFTPKIEQLFNVRMTDRGRALSDFTTRLGYTSLAEDARTVLQRLVPIEREVQAHGDGWYLARVLPYRSQQDRIVGVVVTFVEISGLKRAEAEARRAREFSEHIIETLHDPLLVLNSELLVQSANAAFYEHFNVHPSDTIGSKIYDLGNRQWNIPELRTLLEDVLAKNQTFSDYQVEHDFVDLGHRIMVLSGRRLEDMQLILLSISDITERFRAQETLREADRRKDDYLAMLGHELRNPLGAIRNATELLQKTNTEDAGLARVYGLLQRQALHMSRIIDGLLDVSRIARGKIVLKLGTIDLLAVLEMVLEVRVSQAAARGLELATELNSEPLWVVGDEARLAQVVDNLIGNAIKFTEAPGKVTVSLQREEAFAVVRVRDSGVGISPEILTSIFDSFQQGPQDSARSAGGLGLGLALAKGLVKLHHGSIEAVSGGPGTGAEFVVRLPLAPGPADTPTKEQAAETKPRQILVVEDNVDSAELLRELLTVSGHEVTAVESGDQALDVLRRSKPDVVLCDIGLPGMSGLELARVIRRDPALDQVALIAITGYGQPEDQRLSEEAGFDHHLVKPVDLKQLVRVIDASSRPGA